MTTNKSDSISIVLPAKNEAENLKLLLPQLTSLFPEAEIIVVNDGSSDNTIEVCERNKVSVITHPYCKGNGASVKTGANAARGEILVLMDADGQHQAEDIVRLLDQYYKGFHMIIGARAFKSQTTFARWLANTVYNWLASWVVGHKIEDLTSGFRVVNTKKFREFLHLLPNGFSYPTTITMSFFRAGYSVGYLPIVTGKRTKGSSSHINPIKDGVRFFIIIFKIGTLYSPLKIFLPISLFHFSVGLSLYFYTFINFGRFTNMSALLLTTSVIIFLIGLISEQITSLIFRPIR
jgi:glycosyltransferase involved in cell wall biosynthesis